MGDSNSSEAVMRMARVLEQHTIAAASLSEATKGLAETVENMAGLLITMKQAQQNLRGGEAWRDRRLKTLENASGQPPKPRLG